MCGQSSDQRGGSSSQAAGFPRLWNRAMAHAIEGAGSGAMSDQVESDADVQTLTEEISRLRGQVAQLQERVEQLDHLAHQDSLIDLPNRRGFIRQLERLIARLDRYDEPGATLY